MLDKCAILEVLEVQNKDSVQLRAKNGDGTVTISVESSAEGQLWRAIVTMHFKHTYGSMMHVNLETRAQACLMGIDMLLGLLAPRGWDLSNLEIERGE